MPNADAKALRAFFRKVDVFSGLEGRSLDSVMKVLKRETFPRGHTLFAEGELGRTMYVMQDGEVEVRRANSDGAPVPIVRLGAGECFGEMALVELQPRSATVVTTKKSQVWSLTNLDLWKLFQEDNYAYVIVLQNICRLLSRRLRKADSRISDFISAADTAKRNAALVRRPPTAAARTRR